MSLEDPYLPTINGNTKAAKLYAEYLLLRDAVNTTEIRLSNATCSIDHFFSQGVTEWQKAQDERKEAFKLLEKLKSYAYAWEDHALQCLKEQEPQP
jgi:hypothetical protein